jgi:hypothetical protein
VANADVESQAMQAQIDQYNADRNYQLQQAQADREYQLQQAQLTGNLGTGRTLAGQQFDYNTSTSNPEVQAQILANKAQELANAAQEIQNANLPATLKLQAQRLEQQVKAGALDYDTALAQLNQIKKQTANIGRTTSNSSGSKPTQAETVSYWTSSAIKQLSALPSTEKRNSWLWSNRDEILSQPNGQTIYNQLLSYVYPKS